MAAERTRSTAQANEEGLRVFVAGVPWRIGEETLRRDFEECGVVEDLFLIRDQEGYSRGRCFITFREEAAVQAALKYDGTDYGGRPIYVKVAEPKRKGESKAKRAHDAAKEFPSEKPEGCKSLCLKNIGDATEADVRKLLEGCSVQSVRIVCDHKTGAPRGIAFVDFREGNDVDKAMGFNGKMLRGHKVDMHYETPKERPRPEGCLTVAVKKLPPETTEADLRILLKGLKSITEIRIILDAKRVCTGLAFAEFSEVADVEAAVQRDGMKVKGRVVFICYETKAKKERKETKKRGAQEQEATGEVERVGGKRKRKAKLAKPQPEPGEEERPASAQAGGKGAKQKRGAKKVADEHRDALAGTQAGVGEGRAGADAGEAAEAGGAGAAKKRRRREVAERDVAAARPAGRRREAAASGEVAASDADAA